MVWYAWAMVIGYVLHALGMVYLVDRPRPRVTRVDAVLAVVSASLYIWAIVSLATS